MTKSEEIVSCIQDYSRRVRYLEAECISSADRFLTTLLNGFRETILPEFSKEESKLRENKLKKVNEFIKIAIDINEFFANHDIESLNYDSFEKINSAVVYFNLKKDLLKGDKE